MTAPDDEQERDEERDEMKERARQHVEAVREVCDRSSDLAARGHEQALAARERLSKHRRAR